MAYGEFKFLIAQSSYNSLSQKISFKWTSLERRKLRPLLQFDSVGDEVLTLSGETYRSPDVPEPRDIYRRLRERGLRGEAEVLVDQLGIYWGKWVMEDLDIKSADIDVDSIPRRCDFTMSLKYYG